MDRVPEARKIYKTALIPAGPMDDENSYKKLETLRGLSSNPDSLMTTESVIDIADSDFEVIIKRKETLMMEQNAQQQVNKAVVQQQQKKNEIQIQEYEQKQIEKRKRLAKKVLAAKRIAQKAKSDATEKSNPTLSDNKIILDNKIDNNPNDLVIVDYSKNKNKASEAENQRLKKIEAEKLEDKKQQKLAKKLKRKKSRAAAKLAKKEKTRLAQIEAERKQKEIEIKEAKAEKIRLAEVEKERKQKEIDAKKANEEKIRLAEVEKAKKEKQEIAVKAKEARLAQAKADKKRKKLEAKKAAKAEKTRLAQIEADRKQKEIEAKKAKAEKIRLAEVEKAKAEKVLEAKKIEAEKIRLAQIEADRKQKEIEAKAKAEKIRLAQVEKAKAEKIRLAEVEKAKKEKQEIAAKAEEARLAQAKADKKRKKLEAKKAAKAEKARLAEIEKDRKEKQEIEAKAEKALLAQAKADKKRKKLEAKKAAKAEKARLAQVEKDRKQKEIEAKAKAEKERLAQIEKDRKAKAAAKLLALKKDNESKRTETLANQGQVNKGENSDQGRIVSNRATAAKNRLEHIAQQKAEKEKKVKEAEIAAANKLLNEKPILDDKSTLSVAEQKLRPFYFPINELKSGKAYQYVAGGNHPDTTYKLMRAMELGSETFLIIEEYTAGFELKSIKKEHITPNGVAVKTLTSYETDGLGEKARVICGIDADDYINWGMETGDKSYIQYTYNSSLFPNFDVVIKKNIEVLKQNEPYSYQGKNLNTFTLKDAEVTTFTDHKAVSEERYKLEYINKYAEGVGLVQYKVQMVNHPTEIARTYNLEKVMTYNQWSSASLIRSPARGR